MSGSVARRQIHCQGKVIAGLRRVVASRTAVELDYRRWIYDKERTGCVGDDRIRITEGSIVRGCRKAEHGQHAAGGAKQESC